ncbi:branched-chain amino acid ABC transporter permease [Candidatus Amarolinea aalborgensis]|jgi:branched-chain amino acid transport system permease protein|uniref:branched-chain amino acid ABC transporter permease n=1 Tax=Candidatus Amarolinea aalborgensis TaxID=2249329 RepID=UPI003BF97A2F
MSRFQLRTLRELFTPLVRIVTFAVISSLVMSLVVLILALLLRGSRTDTNLMVAVVALLPQTVIDGITLGFLYALIALGYTMVYGVLEFINFAHSEIYMVGAFAGAELALTLQAANLLLAMPPLLYVVLAVLVGMIVSGLLAVTVERIAYRPLRNAPRLVPLISAVGVSFFLQDAVRLFESFHRNAFYLTFPSLPAFDRRLILGSLPTATGGVIDVGISVKVIVFIVVAILMLIGLNYLVNATKLGTAIRAVAQDRSAAALMGINVNQIIALTFLIGGALGGAAGVLAGIKAGTIDPFFGFIPGIKAFTAAVLGGIGNITGAMLGGITLGLLEAFVSSYLTLFSRGALPGADYAAITAFMILIGILIFKPSGLLGEQVGQKA